VGKFNYKNKPVLNHVLSKDIIITCISIYCWQIFNFVFNVFKIKITYYLF